MNTPSTNVPTKFLIITRGRTGSNFLFSLFDSHPRIRHYSEIISPRRLRNKKGFKEEIVARGSVAFFKKCFEPVDKELTVGMKFHYHHFHENYGKKWDIPDLYQTLDYFVSDRSIKILHLKRRNILKTLISVRVSDQTKQYVLRNESERKNDIRIKLAMADCRREFRQTRENEKKSDGLFRHHEVLEVAYEDLVDEETATCNRILDFLRVPRHPMASKIFQRNTRSLRDVVENYEKIKNKIAGTSREVFFEE